MMIGQFSLGTLIGFVLILGILLFPAWRIYRMYRRKKLSERIVSDATVIDLADREVAAEEPAAAEDSSAPQREEGQEESASAPDVVRGGAAAKRRHRRVEREYFAAFRLQDGERLEIELPGRVYRNIAIGDTGLLTYTDTAFVSYKKIRTEEQPRRRRKLSLRKKEQPAAQSASAEPAAATDSAAPAQTAAEAQAQTQENTAAVG